MKHYKLKKWYPSLHKDWVVGDVVIPWEKQEGYYHIPNKSTTIFKEEVENNPDFWELVKKPLFITEDGIKVVDGMRIHSVRKSNFDRHSYIVDEDFVEEQTSKHPYVYFFHESNADEYIWKNKPLFSYEDFMKWGNVPYERVIRELAMVRSGQA